MRHARLGPLAWCVVMLSVSVGSCGKAPAQQSPVVPSGPPITGPFVSIAGSWTGTFESANQATRTVTLTVVQAVNCVDGTWTSSDNQWSGAISGFATSDSYAGQISFERSAANGGQCQAVANISGPVGDSTLRWTSTGFAAVGTCNGPLPQAVVLALQR
jgi:hypothetical protein